jgi:hypothetical protein
MDAISKRVGGTTMRFTWTTGPTQGKAHDHRFGEDGNVEWRSAATKGAQPAVGEFERARYAAIDVGDDVCLVSYLAKSGYTLTVALNFADNTVCGIASNEKTWTPVRGAFEVLD